MTTTAAEVYRWTPDMGEISGFGGDYEKACKAMLYAGLAWLDDFKEKGAAPHLEAREMAGVYGLFDAASPDAKALEEAVLAAVPDCSGAMHHAVMSICFFVAKNGWAAFVETKVAAQRARLAGEAAKHAEKAVRPSGSEVLRVDVSSEKAIHAPCRVLAMREKGDGLVEIDISMLMLSGGRLPMTWTTTPDMARAFRVGGAAAVILAPAVEPDTAPPEGT